MPRKIGNNRVQANLVRHSDPAAKYNIPKPIRQSTAANGRNRNHMAAPAKPDKKKRRSQKSMAEKLITGGIAVMSSAVVISLFAYFRPFTLEDVSNHVTAGVSRLQEWGNELFFQKDDTDQAMLTDEENKDTVSYMIRTTDVGNVSDFTSEPVFPPQDDSIYSCILDTAIGPMLYYNQGDLRWKSYLYGGSDPISKYGCGPVCVSMLINSFGTASVSPIEMADWSAENGCFAAGGGSYHNLIPKSLSAFGLNVESVSERTAEKAEELLRSHHVLVALMGKGTLTDNGHFIIIAQLTESGNVYIADPASYENSTKEWNLQQLIDELKRSYDSGGPLWAVSLNTEN